MQATLRATEAKQHSVSDIRSGLNHSLKYRISYHVKPLVADPISMANISMQLSDTDDLSTGLILPNPKKATNASVLKDYIGMLSSADSPTQAGRAASFISLGGGGSSSSSSTKVQVEFGVVCGRLRRRVLEAVARERHGDDGVRILRLLLDTGKMDEKQVSHIRSFVIVNSFLNSGHLDIKSCDDVA